MFKIITSYWHYENNNISAYLELIIEDKILLYNEAVSLTKSVPALVSTLVTDYYQDNNPPIFICACGRKECNFATYNLEHKNKFVTITKFNKKHDSSEFFELTFTIPKKDYFIEIINLAKEYLHFEVTLSRIDENYKICDIKEKIEKIEDELKELLKEDETPSEELDLKRILDRIDTKAIIKVINQFPWKIDELINYLFDKDEKIRYKAAEILGILEDTHSLPIIIERLADEEKEIVIASLIRALANMGYLKTYELMDKLYIRKKEQTFLCNRSMKKLADKILILATLLKEVDNKNKFLVLKALDRLNIKKDERVYKVLSDIIVDKKYDKKIRLHSIELILKVDINRSINLLIELLLNKQEDEEVRHKIINSIGYQNNLEVIDVLKNISEDKEDKLKSLAEELLKRKYIKPWL